MRNQIFCVLALCLILSGAELKADMIPKTEWIVISPVGKGSSWALRVADWGHGKGSHKAWVKFDHSKNQNVRARRTMTYFLFNCNEAYTQILSEISFDKFGNTMGGQRGPFDAQPVVPDTNIAAIHDAVCLEKSQ